MSSTNPAIPSSTDLNFEHVIIKNMLENGEYFGKVSPILKKQYFKSPGTQEVYNIINEYYSEYTKIPNLVEIITKSRTVPDKEIRTKISDDIKIIHGTNVLNNKSFLIDETISYVRDAIFTEAVMIGADGVQKHDEAHKLKAWEMMENAFKVSVDSDLGLDYDDIEARIEYYQTELYGILTNNFIELNKRLGSGFLPGTLSVILAASGVGKSLLMTSLISDLIKQGKNILLVSMEMSAPEIIKRVDADILDLNINDLGLKESQEVGEDFNSMSMADLIRKRFKEAKERGIGKFYTKSYAPGTFSAIMLENLLDSYENETGIVFDMVFLDYLGIMKSDRVNYNVGLYSYVKAITEEVRAVAVKKELPICSASQLNRSGTNSLQADNSAVADSIGTVQTADFLCFLLQTEELKERNEIVFKITKNRFNGRTDSFNMNIDYTKMRFKDLLVQPDKQQQDQNEAIANTEVAIEQLHAVEVSKKSLESWV